MKEEYAVSNTPPGGAGLSVRCSPSLRPPSCCQRSASRSIALSFGRPLSLHKLAFSRDALVRFVGALDAILRIVAGWRWELFENLKNAAGYIPTDSRPETNDLSNF